MHVLRTALFRLVRFLVGASELPPPLSPEGGAPAAAIHRVAGGQDTPGEAGDVIGRRSPSPPGGAHASYQSSQARKSLLSKCLAIHCDQWGRCAEVCSNLQRSCVWYECSDLW